MRVDAGIRLILILFLILIKRNNKIIRRLKTFTPTNIIKHINKMLKNIQKEYSNIFKIIFIY